MFLKSNLKWPLYVFSLCQSTGTQSNTHIYRHTESILVFISVRKGPMCFFLTTLCAKNNLSYGCCDAFVCVWVSNKGTTTKKQKYILKWHGNIWSVCEWEREKSMQSYETVILHLFHWAHLITTVTPHLSLISISSCSYICVLSFISSKKSHLSICLCICCCVTYIIGPLGTMMLLSDGSEVFKLKSQQVPGGGRFTDWICDSPSGPCDALSVCVVPYTQTCTDTSVITNQTNIFTDWHRCTAFSPSLFISLYLLMGAASGKRQNHSN